MTDFEIRARDILYPKSFEEGNPQWLRVAHDKNIAKLTSAHYEEMSTARDFFYDNQFDINNAWEKYHGNMTYREFAEEYLTNLSA